MFLLPAFAGVLDSALSSNDRVFVYIYKPYCNYCVKFDPIFKKLSTNYGGKCKFVKIDMNTQEGYKIVNQYNVMYVPYVLAINTKKGRIAQITPDCLIDYACVNTAVNSFVK